MMDMETVDRAGSSYRRMCSVTARLYLSALAPHPATLGALAKLKAAFNCCRSINLLFFPNFKPSLPNVAFPLARNYYSYFNSHLIPVN